MFRIAKSKIKQACVITFVPHILHDFRYIPGRSQKLFHGGHRRTNRTYSTSGSKSESEKEKCQRIIDRAFEPNPPLTENNDIKPNKIRITQMVAPQLPPINETHCEKCQRIIKQIFGEDGNAVEVKNEHVSDLKIPNTEMLQATTANEDIDKLEQKVENIEETPLVEAHKPRLESYMPPKILGVKKRQKYIEKQDIPILNCSIEKPVNNRKRSAILNCSLDNKKARRVSSKGVPTFDDLAKRCIDSEPSQIDERLLKEMQKLGVPQSSGRGSRKRVNDSEFIQTDIMRKPRGPVEKAEIDFSLKKIELDRLQIGLLPPFELATGDLNDNVGNHKISTPSEADKLHPCHLIAEVDQYNSVKDKSAVNNIDNKNISHDESKPQKLLSHVASTVMSGDDTLKDKIKDTKQLIDKQDKLKPIHLKDEITDSIDRSQSQMNHNTESDDKKEDIFTSPDFSSDREIAKESGNTEILRNLLETRTAHLTASKVKLLNFVDDDSTIISKESIHYNETPKVLSQEPKQDNIAILEQAGSHLDDDPLIIFKGASSKTGPEVTTKFSKAAQRSLQSNENVSNKFSLEIERASRGLVLKSNECETTDQDSNDTDYKLERISPNRLLENIDVIFNESSSSSQPTVVVRDYIIDTSDNPAPINPDTAKDPNLKSSVKDLQINSNKKDEHHLEGYTYKQLYQNKNDHAKPQETSEVKAKKSLNLPNEDISHVYEEPIIVTETGRLQRYDNTNQEQMIKHTLNVKIEKEPVPTRFVPAQNLVNPLLDKGAVGHVTKESLQQASVELSKLNLNDSTIKMSELLRRVRERNRLQYYQNFEVKIQGEPQIEPVEGSCGKPSPPCPPPAPKCPPASKCPPPPPPPPPPKPCPNPCKPKCPPTCPPAPCPPKPICPPPKKSPCEKFNSKCSCVEIQDALTLLLYLGPQFHIPQRSMLPVLVCLCTTEKAVKKTEYLAREIIVKLQNLCSIVLIATIKGQIDALGSTVGSTVSYARTYDPWLPIPSWPIPEKQKEKKLVCPKEGCQIPRLTSPCRDVNPCITLPKPNLTKR